MFKSGERTQPLPFLLPIELIGRRATPIAGKKIVSREISSINHHYLISYVCDMKWKEKSLPTSETSRTACKKVYGGNYDEIGDEKRLTLKYWISPTSENDLKLVVRGYSEGRRHLFQLILL